MAQLRRDYQEFVKRGAEIIAIGPEGPKAFNAYWHSQKMPFIGIPDPKHRVAELYSQQVKILKLGRMPALIVIDKKGNIRYRHYGNSISDIPKNEDVLSLLDELNKESVIEGA